MKKTKRIKFIAVYGDDFMLVWDDGSYHRYEDDSWDISSNKPDAEMADPQYWLDVGWERVIEL